MKDLGFKGPYLNLAKLGKIMAQNPCTKAVLLHAFGGSRLGPGRFYRLQGFRVLRA